MTSWEDCTAMIQAGADPSEVMPSIAKVIRSAQSMQTERQRRRRRSQEGEEGNSGLGEKFCPVIEYSSLKMPVKNMPWFVLSILNDDDEENERFLFDEEIDFDVLNLFHTVAIRECSGRNDEVDRFLQEEISLRRDDAGSDEHVHISSNEKQFNKFSNQTELNSLARSFADHTKQIISDVNKQQQFLVNEMNAGEWRILVSKTIQILNDDDIKITIYVINRLLQTVQYQQFARTLLYSTLPVFMKSCDDNTTEIFCKSMQIAVHVGQLSEMNASQFKQLLQIYNINNVSSVLVSEVRLILTSSLYSTK